MTENILPKENKVKIELRGWKQYQIEWSVSGFESQGERTSLAAL